MSINCILLTKVRSKGLAIQSICTSGIIQMRKGNSPHEEGDQDLKQPDDKAERGPDHLNKTELFGKEFVQHRLQSVVREPRDLFHHDPFQIEILPQMGDVALQDHREELLQLLHKDSLQLPDGLLPDEHRDHRHGLLQLVAKEVIDVLFNYRQDPLYILRIGDRSFNITKG